MLNILNAVGPHSVLERRHSYSCGKDVKFEASGDEVINDICSFYYDITKSYGHAGY